MSRLSLCALVFIVLSGCGQNDAVTIGFIGGLTGHTADLGSHSRNGMILAIEQRNAQGGIGGKDIHTITKDDKQNVQQATAAINELIAAQVDAIVGPSTSSMAVVVSPIADKAGITLIGTTVTTNQLSNLDDSFFRTLAATQNSTANLARYLQSELAPKQLAIVQDMSNEAYTASWREDFSRSMSEGGADIALVKQFNSGDNRALLDISAQLGQFSSDLIVLITNSTDAALLVKQIRSHNKQVNIVVCEWAATGQFMQLAGREAEGIFAPRYIDDSSTDAQFLALQQAYQQRFGQAMGYPALLGYNATNALLDALSNKSKAQSVKEYLLEKRLFSGVLASFEFDDNGDEVRNAFHFITQVQDGQFVTLKD